MSKHIFLYYYKVLIMGATWQSLTSETIDQMNNLGGGAVHKTESTITYLFS